MNTTNTMNLKTECGVTRISLDNAEKLLKKFGKPDTITLEYDPEKWWLVKTSWRLQNFSWTFTGFSWGYYLINLLIKLIS